MATVQLFRREARSYARFEDINRTHRDSNIAGIVYYAVFYPTIEIIGALAASLIIWYGGAWVLQDSLTLGVLVAFLLYAQRFFRPISDMSEKFNVLQAAMASSERIFTLLDTPVLLKNQRNPVSRSGQATGRIEFDRVWFAYNEKDFVLRDVSFEVAPGERIGFVGATGAGKTKNINL